MQPWLYQVVTALCLGLSGFQLHVVYFPTNSTLVRSVHLTFAIVPAYLLYAILYFSRNRRREPAPATA